MNGNICTFTGRELFSPYVSCIFQVSGIDRIQWLPLSTTAIPTMMLKLNMLFCLVNHNQQLFSFVDLFLVYNY